MGWGAGADREAMPLPLLFLKSYFTRNSFLGILFCVILKDIGRPVVRTLSVSLILEFDPNYRK